MVRREFECEESVEEEKSFPRRRYPIQRRTPRLEGGASADIKGKHRHSILDEPGKLNRLSFHSMIYIE